MSNLNKGEVFDEISKLIVSNMLDNQKLNEYFSQLVDL